jgi:hypothetical protein
MFQMRMNELEWARLQGEAEKRDMKVADLVRQRLGTLLGPSGASGRHDGPVGTVDLPLWLGGRLKLPTGVARLYVESGRVTIDGNVFREMRAPKGRLERVELDGEPV